ncbi:hypothetical protein [Sinorhizobium meliloti]|uniref:hypothetical protein n=1 Tax=Rhizobium meliloti TaxID=382 RepID=UPI00398D4491
MKTRDLHENAARNRDCEGLPLGAVRRGSVSPEGGKRVRKWSSRVTGERLKWIGA